MILIGSNTVLVIVLKTLLLPYHIFSLSYLNRRQQSLSSIILIRQNNIQTIFLTHNYMKTIWWRYLKLFIWKRFKLSPKSFCNWLTDNNEFVKTSNSISSQSPSFHPTIASLLSAHFNFVESAFSRFDFVGKV